MAKHISKQLAEHIDKTCGVWETGGVAQFIDDDGTLLEINCSNAFANEFAYSIAVPLIVHQGDSHNDYKDNMENAIQINIHSLRKVLEAVKSFQTPEMLTVGATVHWADPDEDKCSGVYKIVGINGEIYSLVNEHGSEVEALKHEIKAVEA